MEAAGGNEHSKINLDLCGDDGTHMNNLGGFIGVLSCQVLIKSASFLFLFFAV